MLPRRITAAAGQEGFSLIEVVISAMVLLLVTLGTLSMIDTAAQSTTQNRARTAAADLAEQDQELLRATAATTLGGDVATGRQGYSNPHTTSVGGISYSVASTAEWISDATGATPSCTDPDGVATYLKLTSTVTPVGSSHIAPVTMSSFLTPTAGSFGRHTGTLTIQLLNRSGGPQPNVPVNINGPQSASLPTNAAGCAIFNYIPSGVYTASWSKSGYVDPDGKASPTASATVADAATTRVSKRYDVAGGITFNIKTKGGAASTANEVTVANGQMAGSRTFPLAGPLVVPLSTIATGNALFPFTDGYSAYTGDCVANSPSGYTGESLSTLASLGAGAAATLTVSQPSIKLTVKKSVTVSGVTTTSVVPLADVVAVPSSTDQALGCTTTYRFVADATGVVNAGLPYGQYAFCVDDNVPLVGRKVTSTTYTNDKLNTVLSPTVTIPATAGASPGGYQAGGC
jgi:Tfp pilus assembly protein PilV